MSVKARRWATDVLAVDIDGDGPHDLNRGITQHDTCHPPIRVIKNIAVVIHESIRTQN